MASKGVPRGVVTQQEQVEAPANSIRFLPTAARRSPHDRDGRGDTAYEQTESLSVRNGQNRNSSSTSRSASVKRQLFLPFSDNQNSRSALLRSAGRRQLEFPVSAPATITMHASCPQPLGAGRSGVSRSAATANVAEHGPQRLVAATQPRHGAYSTNLAQGFVPSSSGARPPLAFFACSAR